jgi:hypothetical protein
LLDPAAKGVISSVSGPILAVVARQHIRQFSFPSMTVRELPDKLA